MHLYAGSRERIQSLQLRAPEGIGEIYGLVGNRLQKTLKMRNFAPNLGEGFHLILTSKLNDRHRILYAVTQFRDAAALYQRF